VPHLTDHPAVLLRINRRWKPGMSDDDIYDAGRGWWVMGEKRDACEYAIFVAGGEVRAVFRIHHWALRRPGDPGWQAGKKPRWGFDGEPVPELRHLVGTDVSWLFPPGAANPVRYLNV